MKIKPFIKKDFAEPFRIFFANGQYIAQWDFVPSEDIEGWGNITEDSVHPCGDVRLDIQAIIALRYSWQDELALQRQRDTKPDDFTEYNAFCEEAKRVAKETLNIEQDIK